MAKIIEKILELLKKQKNANIYDENGWAKIPDIIKQGNISINLKKKPHELDYIKFENLIDLKEYKAKQRNGTLGVSSKILGSYWCNLPKGRAIFKDFDACNNSDSLRQTYMSNELMVAELAELIKLPHAEYEPAKIGDVVGLVSYDALGDANISTVNIKNVFDVNREAILNRQIRDRLDIDQINQNLLKMSVLDILTLQADRNSGSFKCIQDEESGKITMSALWDNERAFFDGFIMRAGGKENFVDNQDRMQSLIKNEEARTSSGDNNYCIIYNKFGLNERIKECVIFSKTDYRLIETLIDTINKIDIQTANENLKAKGVIMNQAYLNNIGYIIDQIKAKFIAEVEKQNVGEFDKESGLLIAKNITKRKELSNSEHVERIKKALTLEIAEIEKFSDNKDVAQRKYIRTIRLMKSLFENYASLVIHKQNTDFSSVILAVLGEKMEHCPDETTEDGICQKFQQDLINAKSVAVCVDVWAKKGMEKEFAESLYLILRRKAEKYKEVYSFNDKQLDVFPKKLNEQSVKNNPFLNRVLEEAEEQELEVKLTELFKKFYKELGQMSNVENQVENVEDIDNNGISV